MTNTDYQNKSDLIKNNFVNQPEEESLDIRKYLGFFLSNWYLFIITLLIAISLAYGINTYSEQIYSVSSSLLIKDDKNNSDLSGTEKMIPGGDIFRNQQNLQNEIGILKSYYLNLRVMDELKDFHISYVGVGRRGIAETVLYNDCPIILFCNDLQRTPFGTPINVKIISKEEYILDIPDYKINSQTFKFNQQVTESGLNFTIQLRHPELFVYRSELSNKFRIRFEHPENLANLYRYKLSIQPIDKDATLVNLTTTGSVPTQISDYLNKLMEIYITQGLEEKNRTADSTIKFIDRQLKILSDSLKKAEDRLEKFRLNNKMIDLSSEGGEIKTRLEKFENERTILNLQLQYYEYLGGYIKSKNESGDIISPSIMSVTDPVLIKLVENLSTLQVQKKQLRYNLNEELPAVGLIDSKIEDAKNALEENIRNSVINIKRELDDVCGRIESVDILVAKLPITERNKVNIQREYDLNNTVYTYMLEKRSEASIAKASSVSSNRIIDRAVPANSARLKPKPTKNYFIAFLLGLLFPALYIFLTDQLNNKIIDKRDIEKRTNVPVLGFIGHSDYKKELPVISNPGSSLAESFRSIRTNLKYYMTNEKSTIISVTSTISGEGKTFFSTNLAAIIAMLGKKTLIVGLDLRKPRIQKIFPNTSNNGLTNFLIGECELKDILVKTDIENLYFLPSGPIPPNPSELLESKRMADFIKGIREEFNYIIFDTPPIGIVSDALILSTVADINIFVVRQRFSAKNTLDHIQNLYQQNNFKNASIVVNDINVKGYYGYGLRYGDGLYAGYGYDYGYGRYGTYNYGKYGNYYTED